MRKRYRSNSYRFFISKKLITHFALESHRNVYLAYQLTPLGVIYFNSTRVKMI
jgi:hypothetical protein